MRICMCWQLAPLARALGREAAAEKLLPEALEVRHRAGSLSRKRLVRSLLAVCC